MNALLIHVLQLLGFFVLCFGGWYGLLGVGSLVDRMVNALGPKVQCPCHNPNHPNHRK